MRTASQILGPRQSAQPSGKIDVKTLERLVAKCKRYTRSHSALLIERRADRLVALVSLNFSGVEAEQTVTGCCPSRPEDRKDDRSSLMAIWDSEVKYLGMTVQTLSIADLVATVDRQIVFLGWLSFAGFDTRDPGCLGLIRSCAQQSSTLLLGVGA